MADDSRWFAACRERAAKYNVPCEDVPRAAIWAKTRGYCHICRRPLNPRDWHADHVVPISRGGWNTLSNLMPAHPTCNRRKSAARRSDLDPRIVRALQDALWTEYAIDAPRAKGIGADGVISGPQCWTLALAMPARAAELAITKAPVLSRVIGRPVECLDIPGVAGVIGVRIPRPLQHIVPLRVMPPARRLAIQIGMTAWGRPAWLNLANDTTPHLLAAGATGGGKSAALRVVIRALALGNAPSALRLAIADPSGKMRALRPFARLSHLLWPIASTPADTLSIIAAFEREIIRRGREDDRLAPPWVLVIDELPALGDPAALRTLLSIGREMGIHVIAAMQAERAADIDPRAAGQFGARLCTRVAPNDGWTSGAMIGSTVAKRLAHPGDAYLYTPTGLARIKVAYAADDDACWTAPAWLALQADAPAPALAQGGTLPRPNPRRKQPDTPPAPVVEWVEGILESEGKLPAINRAARALGVGNDVAKRWLTHLSVYHPIRATQVPG